MHIHGEVVQRLMRPERNWHMLFLLGMALLSGVAGLIPAIPATTIEDSFPGPMRYLWYGGLILCSGAAIWGYLNGVVTRVPPHATEDDLRRWMQRVMLGMSVERTAMIVLAGLCASYTVAAYLVASNRVLAALSIATVAAFALANIFRARQLRLALRHIHDRLDEGAGR